MLFGTILLAAVLEGGGLATGSERVFVEAESFATLGGWVIDQQFMDVMGSPYLLAHGIGRPVEDAVTKVDFATAGKRRLFVRTRDWVSPHGPGRFRVKVGDWTSRELGVGNGDWHWEDCGVVDVAGEMEVRLCDLTGFEGRVDALCFVPDGESPVRPSKAVEEGEAFDFVVVGGGFSGMCAAVAAARAGVRTALVQDRPVFGGNGSNECRVAPSGGLDVGPFPRNADLMKELRAMMPRHQGPACSDNYRIDDEAVGKWLLAETNLSVFASTRCVAAERGTDGSIASVVLHDIRNSRRFRIRARFFCDATGDASLAEQAGVETRWDAECREDTGEKLAPHRGNRRESGGLESSCLWFARDAGVVRPFPRCQWALDVARDEDALVEGEIGKTNWLLSGNWSWGSGFYRDPVKEGEAIRDWNFRAIYGLWDYLKNRAAYSGNYASAEIYWLGYILAKRDAHRIVGDYVVTGTDMLEGRKFDDGVVTTTWYLDLHGPAPTVEAKFPGGAFRTTGVVLHDGRRADIKPFEIPFRCFYSKDAPNLFAAGKVISGTYVALGSYRVENTCGMMGTMVGRAAALCLRLGVSPRKLGKSHLAELKAVLSKPETICYNSRMKKCTFPDWSSLTPEKAAADLPRR